MGRNSKITPSGYIFALNPRTAASFRTTLRCSADSYGAAASVNGVVSLFHSKNTDTGDISVVAATPNDAITLHTQMESMTIAALP